MRYHTEKNDGPQPLNLAVTYSCYHPIYTRCTLLRFSNDGRGLAIIQQRFDEKTKRTWWDKIDDWIAPKIYLSKRFGNYYELNAAKPVNKLYPTVTVRQAMWALRIKPLPKEPWETVFDRKIYIPYYEKTDDIKEVEL